MVFILYYYIKPIFFLFFFPKIIIIIILFFFPLKICTWWELASWMPLFVVGSLPTTLGCLVTTQNSKDLIVTTKNSCGASFYQRKNGESFWNIPFKEIEWESSNLFIYLFIK